MVSTANSMLKAASQFYKWAMKHGLANGNPASGDEVERAEAKLSERQIFTPDEMRERLYRIDDGLKAAVALWAFGGVRKEEIARLMWQDEINPALASGFIYISAEKAKTGRDRSIRVNDALRAWLETYRQSSGPVLPVEYGQGRALDRLTRTISRMTGLPWKENAPRHSYATYSLAAGESPRAVCAAMGNSLAVLDRHYNNRAASITKATAAEYFGIRPPDKGNVIPLPAPAPIAETTAQPQPAFAASGVS